MTFIFVNKTIVLFQIDWSNVQPRVWMVIMFVKWVQGQDQSPEAYWKVVQNTWL